MTHPENKIKTRSLDYFIRLHGRKVSLIVLIVVVYFFLDTGVSYSFTTDKETYAVGEIITATVQVNNPYPFPIRYWGYSSNIIPEEGVPLKEIVGYAGQAAADKANWYSGKLGKGIWLDSLESRVISLHHYAASEEGSYRMEGLVRHRTMYWQSSVDYTNTEFKPVWVSGNSTGIALFADMDNTIVPPKVALFVRNNNMYPVRLPVFDELIVHYGSVNSTTSSGIMIEWVVSHFDVPAMSTDRIFTTFSFMATEENPIYYSLYGTTVKYPPE